jgi:flagella basal body P-ring formation protein FlgA
MESGKAYLPPRPETAAGRELSRNLVSGEPVLAGDAVPAQAVKRGETVQSVTRNRAWEVRGRGKALSGGMVGDVVTVEDAGTKVKYQARITDRGVVSVLPGQK